MKWKKSIKPVMVLVLVLALVSLAGLVSGQTLDYTNQINVTNCFNVTQADTWYNVMNNITCTGEHIAITVNNSGIRSNPTQTERFKIGRGSGTPACLIEFDGVNDNDCDGEAGLTNNSLYNIWLERTTGASSRIINNFGTGVVNMEDCKVTDVVGGFDLIFNSQASTQTTSSIFTQIEMQCAVATASDFCFRIQSGNVNALTQYTYNNLTYSGDRGIIAGIYINVSNSIFNLTGTPNVFYGANGVTEINFVDNIVYMGNGFSGNVMWSGLEASSTYSMSGNKFYAPANFSGKFIFDGVSSTTYANGNYYNWTIASGECTLDSATGKCNENITLGSDTAGVYTDTDAWYCESLDSSCVPASPTTTNTSFFAFDFEPGDFTFGNTEYQTVYELQFNTSAASTSFIDMTTLNIERTTGGGTTDIDVRVLVDDVEVFEELAIRTLGSGIGQPGSTGFIYNFTVANGEHNISYQYKRTGGSGTFTLTNVGHNLGQLLTTTNTAVTGNIVDINVTFSNTEFQDILNFTLDKDGLVNSSTYHVAKLTLNTDAGTPRVFCQISDGDYMVRDLVVGASGSGAVIYLEEPTATHNDSLRCRTTANTITMTGQLVYFNMADNNNNTIEYATASNTSTNSTDTLILAAGMHRLTNITFNITNGTQAFLTSQISLQSDTGTQEVSMYLNSSTVNCSAQIDRYFAASNAVGVMYEFHHCTGLTPNTVYSFDVWLEVDAGEQVTVFDETLAGFTTTPFDTATLNTPPIVMIEFPTNGSTVTNTITINWTITDTQNDTYLFNLTIGNTTTPTFITTNGGITVFETTFNTNTIVNGTYNITLTVQENASNELFISTDFITITINNPAPFNATAEVNNCILTGQFVNGTNCAIGDTLEEVRMSAITGIFLLTVTLLVVSIWATWFFENLVWRIGFGLTSGYLLVFNTMMAYLTLEDLGFTAAVNIFTPFYQFSTMIVRWGIFAVIAFLLYFSMSIFLDKKKTKEVDQGMEDF